MEKIGIGRIGEILAIRELQNRGFWVKWMALTTGRGYDILALKNNKEIKIEVKIVPNEARVQYMYNSLINTGWCRKAEFLLFIEMKRTPYYRTINSWMIPVRKTYLNIRKFKNYKDWGE